MHCSHHTMIEPDQQNDQPCSCGIRTTIQYALEYLAAGLSAGEMWADCLHLMVEDIRVGLSLAADRELRSRVISLKYTAPGSK